MIDLTPTDEQEELIDWAAGLLERELPAGKLLATDVVSFPIVELARRLGEAGFFAFTAPTDEGGSGLSVVDEVLMFREIGRRITPGPLLSTTIAARLAAVGEARELSLALGGGRSLAGLGELRGRHQLVVWDAGSVDYLVVVGDEGREMSLIPSADLPTLEFVESIDPFHRMAMLEWADLPSPVAVAGPAAPQLLAHARVLTAAVLTGIAEGARDDSASYAKTRVQFGTPIGAFQAVKHRCADNALRAEAAWAQTAVAAIRLADVGPDGAELDVAAAKLVAGDAAIRNSRDNIQNHGGIGYTAENQAHLFLKRAHLLANSLGDARSFTGLLIDGSPSW